MKLSGVVSRRRFDGDAFRYTSDVHALAHTLCGGGPRHGGWISALRPRPYERARSHRLGDGALRLRLLKGALGHNPGGAALGLILYEGALRHTLCWDALILRLLEGALSYGFGEDVLRQGCAVFLGLRRWSPISSFAIRTEVCVFV